MSQHGLREVALEIAASGPSRFMSVASREGLARILRGCETKSRPIGCRARNAPALPRDFIQSSRATPVGRAGSSQTDPPAIGGAQTVADRAWRAASADSDRRGGDSLKPSRRERGVPAPARLCVEGRGGEVRNPSARSERFGAPCPPEAGDARHARSAH